MNSKVKKGSLKKPSRTGKPKSSAQAQSKSSDSTAAASLSQTSSIRGKANITDGSVNHGKTTYLLDTAQRPKRTPFGRTKKRTLKRTNKSATEEEAHVQSILHELEKLGSNPFDWTAFSPTRQGTWLRDEPDARLHSAVKRQGGADEKYRSRSMSPSMRSPHRSSTVTTPGGNASVSSLRAAPPVKSASASLLASTVATRSAYSATYEDGENLSVNKEFETSAKFRTTHCGPAGQTYSSNRISTRSRSWSPTRQQFPRYDRTGGLIPRRDVGDTYTFLHPVNDAPSLSAASNIDEISARGRASSAVHRELSRSRSRSRSVSRGRSGTRGLASSAPEKGPSRHARKQHNTVRHVHSLSSIPGSRVSFALGEDPAAAVSPVRGHASNYHAKTRDKASPPKGPHARRALSLTRLLAPSEDGSAGNLAGGRSSQESRHVESSFDRNLGFPSFTLARGSSSLKGHLGLAKGSMYVPKSFEYKIQNGFDTDTVCLKEEKKFTNRRFSSDKRRSVLHNMHHYAKYEVGSKSHPSKSLFYAHVQMERTLQNEITQAAMRANMETSSMGDESVAESKGEMSLSELTADRLRTDTATAIAFAAEHLARGAWKFLRILYVHSKRRKDPVILDQIHLRNGLIDSLATLHVRAFNAKRRALICLTSQVRWFWHVFISRFMHAVTYRHTFGRSTRRAAQYYFHSRARRALSEWRRGRVQRTLTQKRRAHARRGLVQLIAARALRCWARWSWVSRSVIWYLPPGAYHLVKRRTLNTFRRYRRMQLQLDRKRSLQRKVSTHGYRITSLALYGLPVWLQWHQRRLRCQYAAPSLARKHRLQRLLSRFRSYTDTTISDYPSLMHWRSVSLQKSLIALVAWRFSKERRSQIFSKSLWVRIRYLARSTLRYWRKSARNNSRKRTNDNLGSQYWRRRVGRASLKTMLHRAKLVKKWKTNRLGYAPAFIRIANLKKSKLLCGRVTLHCALRQWVQFMFTRCDDSRDRSKWRKTITKHLSRRTFAKLLKKANRVRFDNSPAFYKTNAPNRVSRLLERRFLKTLLFLRSHRKAASKVTRFRANHMNTVVLRYSLCNWHCSTTERVRARADRQESVLDVLLTKAWVTYQDSLDEHVERRRMLAQMTASADKLRALQVQRGAFQAWLRSHHNLEDEEKIASAFHEGKFFRQMFQHAMLFIKHRRFLHRAHLKSELYMCSNGLSRWRSHVKEQRRKQWSVENSRKYTPLARKAMLGKLSPIAVSGRFYFSRLRVFSRHLGQKSERGESSVVHMRHYSLGLVIQRLIENTVKEMRDRRVQEIRASEEKFMLMARALRRFKDVAPNEGILRTTRRRTIQWKHWRYADAWRPKYLVWYALVKLRRNVTKKKRTRKRTRKYLKLQNQNKVHLYWRHWMKERRLLKAEMLIHKRIVRRIVDLWTRKMLNRKLMKGVVQKMVAGHHNRCFTSAFNEWRFDTYIENLVLSAKRKKKAIHSAHFVQNLLATAKRCRKNRFTMRRAELNDKWIKFHHLVYQVLHAKIEKRNARWDRYEEMDMHYNRCKAREVLMSLLVFQKIQKALKFRQIKVYDEFMFCLKRLVNRTRYHKALMEVGVQMLRRKKFHMFRRAVNKSIHHRKLSEYAARVGRKPIQVAYFTGHGAIRRALLQMEDYHMRYRKQVAVTVFFRYYRWQVERRTRNQKCAEYYTLRRMHVALHKFITYRSRHVDSRKSYALVHRARLASALQRSLFKLQFRGFDSWTISQKGRLLDARMRQYRLAKGLRRMADLSRDASYARASHS